MNLTKTSCLVTGGAGFIGSHLVDQLIKKGCKVRVIDNLCNGKFDNIRHHQTNSNFDFFQGSIIDPFDVMRVMKNIDIVFHLACLGVRHSLTHPYENHKINAEGTLLLLEAARKEGVHKFIHCSTSEVYGTAAFVPMTEDHPTHPCTVYGSSKLAGEAYSRSYHLTHGLPVIIIRPFNTYGPRSHHEGDAGEMIPKSIVRLLSHKKIIIFGDGSQTRDFTYVEDTARGFVAAAESDILVGKTLNIGSHFEISVKNLAERLVEKIKGIATSNQIHFSDNRPGDVLRLFADASQFIQLTTWKPEVPFEEGLDRTIEYFSNHPLDIQKLGQEELGCNWSIAVI